MYESSHIAEHLKFLWFHKYICYFIIYFQSSKYVGWLVKNSVTIRTFDKQPQNSAAMLLLHGKLC